MRELARLVRIGGVWRFARGPVVGATSADFPEEWDETRAQLAPVIARILWHAHVDAEIVLEDVRSPTEQGRRHLRDPRLELVRADRGHVELTVSSTGNDYVAGIVSAWSTGVELQPDREARNMGLIYSTSESGRRPRETTAT